MIGKIGRKALHCGVDQLPLNLRRDASRLLVHRHDAAGVNRLALLVVENFILRVGELQAAHAHLDRAKQHDVLSRGEDVPQK